MDAEELLPPYEETIGAVLIGANERVIAPLRPVLRKHNITEPQWRVMRVVNDRWPTHATEIAQISQLRAPSVTRILQELDERGLVVREADVGDRRRRLVSLSDEGRRLVETTSRVMVGILDEYADLFGARRLARLSEELRALSAALSGVE